MMLGYARVSTIEQDTTLQINALKRAGVCAYWEEQQSGIKSRPELESLLKTIRPGTTVVVYKVDRLARSLQDLLRISEKITKSGAALKSITEPIDTGTPTGKMMFQLLGVFAEFERSVILERCNAGRIAAKAAGRRTGRLRKLNYEAAVRMRNAGLTFREIAQSQNVSQSTVIKAIERINAGLSKVEGS